MSFSKIKLLKKNYPKGNDNTIFGLLSQGGNVVYDEMNVVCKYIFILDTSNSMNNRDGGVKSRKELLIDSMVKLVNSAAMNDKVMSVYCFSDSSELRLPDTVVNESTKHGIVETIKDLKKTIGRKTFLYKPLEDVYDSVYDDGECFYHVVLFTDGDDFEPYQTLEILEKLREDKNVTVSFVAFGDEYQMDMLNSFTNAGRGSFYHLSDIKSFYSEIRNDIKIASKRKIAKAVLKYDNQNGDFTLDSVFKVGEGGISRLDAGTGIGALDGISIGGLSESDQIFFKVSQSAIDRPGDYCAGVFEVRIGKQKIKSLDVMISVVEEAVMELPDPEISDMIRRIRLFDISLEVEKLQKEGKPKEAEAKLKSAMPIAQQLGIGDDVTVILKSKDKNGNLNLDMTRKLVADTKTKGLRKNK